MRTILNTIKTQLEAGQDLVLVTIIASSGSTPRGPGARMLVGHEGRICGTIGGGAVEYRAQQIARQVLEQKQPCDHAFLLTHENVQELGMICGGSCHVFFHFLPAGDADIMTLAEDAELRFRRGEPFWLVSDLAAGGQLSLADKRDPLLGPCLTRNPCRLQEDGRDLFLEQISFSDRVYIFGGGHVSQELVPVLAHVGFRCTVLDDREEFTNPALFPGAEQCILGDFNRISDFLTITGEDYVCVMTRGHAYDTAVQAQVLRCRPCYCGVIGSKAKAAGVRRRLQEEYGFSDQELDLITTPIGLSIKGRTPAEIAISIAAQLILVRAQRSGL